MQRARASVWRLRGFCVCVAGVAAVAFSVGFYIFCLCVLGFCALLSARYTTDVVAYIHKAAGPKSTSTSSSFSSYGIGLMRTRSVRVCFKRQRCR